MSLYPEILFHFTNKTAFYNILSSTFKLSYAREKIKGPTQDREFAVPIISFCDLKLSELKYINYGNYGIGLTKEWANKNGLTPVMYISKHSDLLDNYAQSLGIYFNHIGNLNTTNATTLNSLISSYSNLLNFYRYIKNYEGELIRRGKLIDPNYRFADEREWRYVPQLNTNIPTFIDIKSIATSSQKAKYNKQISHIRLSFQPDDIKYLIVKDDNDIIDLINHLHHVKSKFTQDIITKLSSRILTQEQIKSDM